jgi:AraC-like DNA-binding protein
MKLYFFIREMEVETRTISSPGDEDHPMNQILFCAGGEGKLVASRRRISLRPGELLFNPEGKILSGKAPLRLIQVLFSEELFSPSVAMEKEALYVLGIIKIYARRQNRIVLSQIGSERLSTLLDNMLWEFRERRRGYSWALRLKLIELLITVIRDKQFTIPIRDLKPFTNTHIQDVVLYLHTEYMNPISVEDILELCALSRSHFHALFKRETGQTLISYLSALRCEKAAELLRTTDRTIMQISQDAGFNNLSHFYHTFRRRYNVSPGEFRGA